MTLPLQFENKRAGQRVIAVLREATAVWLPEASLVIGRNGPANAANLDTRRPAKFITPIPKPKKQQGAAKQSALLFDDELFYSDPAVPSATINGVRAAVATGAR
jgi:hypothetical protein